MDWAKHTTVLAAAVAAASLAVTAWGTWKSAQVSDDQLTQSKSAREDDQRRQVAQITFYPKDGRVVIANRSYDPATATLAYGSLEGVVSIGLLPPCTQVSFPLKELNPPTTFDLAITDASGREWRRDESGRLIPVGEIPEYSYGTGFFEQDTTLHLKSEPAKGCA